MGHVPLNRNIHTAFVIASLDMHQMAWITNKLTYDAYMRKIMTNSPSLQNVRDTANDKYTTRTNE